MAAVNSLSIVVPVYNEIENLEKLCAEIENAIEIVAPHVWEVILVNDGSHDGSGEWLAARSEANPGFRAIHFESNQGQTAAFDADCRAERNPGRIGRLFNCNGRCFFIWREAPKPKCLPGLLSPIKV